MKRKTIIILSLLLILVVPAAADAYYAPGDKWGSSTVYYMNDTNLSGTATSCINAMANAWTDAPGNWVLRNAGPHTAYWTKASFKAKGWPDWPGISAVSVNMSHIVTGVTSYLNTDYNWNNSGIMNVSTRNCDYKTISLHEMGHWGVLDHPSLIGQNHPEAVMQPAWVAKQSLTTDDKSGIDYLY
ncbi:MAG: matrixin family metalloprotease [Actinomycetota bacterium]|nr:matrixin family metalloprotease [Actinomycetota bacterium]